MLSVQRAVSDAECAACCEWCWVCSVSQSVHMHTLYSAHGSLPLTAL